MENCTVDGDQTARRSSIDAIVDSETDACVILKNGIVLWPKKHSVRKVKFYDGFNKELIPNPLAEWHRLDKCILQSGSMTVNGDCCINDNDEGGNDEMDKMNDRDVSRARAEQRRQNKIL